MKKDFAGFGFRGGFGPPGETRPFFDDSLEEEFRKVDSILAHGGDSFGISAVHFDTFEELLWMGDREGHVTSYYSPNLEKNTSFKVSVNQEIRQILSLDETILILTESQLRGQMRKEIPAFTHTSDSLINMQCMHPLINSNLLVLGGYQDTLVEYDLFQNVETKTVHIGGSGCAMLRGQGINRICAGLTCGQVLILDTRTYRVVQRIEAHSGGLSDMDVHGNLLVTCGFSNHYGACSVDRFLKIYDLRCLRPQAPINISIDPIMLRFLPNYSSRIVALSHGGQMEILETKIQPTANDDVYQVTSNGAESRAFDVSPCCHHIAFGDENGTLNLFSSIPSSNPCPRDTEFLDPVEPQPQPQPEPEPQPQPPLVDDLVCMASIPMPLSSLNVNEPLSSDWPHDIIQPKYRQLQEIDHNILQPMKIVEPIGYAPNPGTFWGNQMQCTFDQKGGGSGEGPTSPPSSQGLSSSASSTFLQPTSTLNLYDWAIAWATPPISHPPVPQNNINHDQSLPHTSVGQIHEHPVPQHNIHHAQSLPHTNFGQIHHPSVPQDNIHHAQSLPHTSVGQIHHPPAPQYNIHHAQSLTHTSVGQIHEHLVPQYNIHHAQSLPHTSIGQIHQHAVPQYNIHHAQSLPHTSVGQIHHPPTYSASQHLLPTACMAQTQARYYYIPKRYTRLEWTPSFFEPPNMESFNKTKFSGLEAITVNSYCNPMLQILYHVEYLRGYLISHLCKKEACLSCEMGFLFHMLDKSKCLPCAGSNFLRAFRVVPEASAQGLVKEESQAKLRSSNFRLIQSWNRFILHQIEMETGKENSEEDAISKFFAMKQDNINRCMRCLREEKKESKVLLSNLLYSLDGTGNGNGCKFVEILQRSLYPEQTTPAWCDQCQNYQLTFQSRAPKALPVILSLNTCLDNVHDFTMWKNYLETLIPPKAEGSSNSFPSSSNSGIGSPPSGHLKPCRYGGSCTRPDCKFWHDSARSSHWGFETKPSDFDLNPEVQVKWLPSKIRVTIGEHGRVAVVDLDSVPKPTPILRSESRLAADFELFGVVIFVQDPQQREEKNNLVSILKMDTPYFKRANEAPTKEGWYLFNDVYIKEVPSTEAMSFNPKWKIPSVLYYRRTKVPRKLTFFPIKPTITLNLFKQILTSTRMGKNRNKPLTYTPLRHDEIPRRGQLVGIDAEFVMIHPEEKDFRDGKSITVNQQQLALARVTCLRGQGPLEGTPFLDDYISTHDTIVDYLTKYSGIMPGDLDPKFSPKHTVSLKSVYIKLRYLINVGVKFVGHGLSNDFKVINIVVPPEQVIDTVNLFRLPDQRMVSLRFLSWHFLDKIIQTNTHDSTEDARAALELYRRFQILKEAGVVEIALNELYDVGRQVYWKVNPEQ